MAIHRFSDLQLRFDLDLDDVTDDAQERAISAEEARLISATARKALDERRRTKDESWAGDYLKLVEQGWPWRVACYIAWSASPKGKRWPETLQELATGVLGLSSPRVIYTWRRKHPSIDTVVAMMQAAPLFEHRRDVFEALVEMAKTPDYKSFNDRKLFLEMIGDYVPKSKLDIGKAGKANDLSELSDEELDALLGDQRPMSSNQGPETEEAGDGDGQLDDD